uniref:DNA-directed DNA polymerase n=1 Tax=Tanacetum cinerariifolium TaxID=118510 RepID=A0A6L2N965_TANCI|nr:DNA-directed DNA polymerase [Tanacetum cinerariifolium]
MSTCSFARRLLSPIEDPERLLSRRDRGEPSLLFDLEEDDMTEQVPPQGLIPDLHPMEELLQAPTDGVGDAIITTNLRNEITRFQQRFGETFAEAWDRFKDLFNKCPHHGFYPLHQINTFYNSLNQSEQDSLNSAAGGNFLTKNTQEALNIIENKCKVQTSRNKPQVTSTSGSSTQDAHVTALTKQVEALLSSFKQPVNSIQNGCETCGGPHPYYECQAANGYTHDVYATSGTYNQGGNSYQPQDDFLRQLLIQNQNLKIDQEATNQFVRTQIGQLTKALQERPQDGPSIPSLPSSSPKEVERDPESTTDQELTESTTRVPPSVIQPSPTSTSYELPFSPVSSPVIPEQNPHQPLIPYPSSFAEALAHMHEFAKMVKDLLTNKEKLLEPENNPLNENCSAVLLKKLLENYETLGDTISSRAYSHSDDRTIAYPSGIVEDVFVQVGKFTFPADFVVVDYDVDPRVPLILGIPFLRIAHALVDVHEEELTLRVGDEKLVFNAESTSKYPRKHGDESIHKIGILDITCEDHFHKDSDFILEKIDTFLVYNDSTSPNVDDGTFDMEGDILLIETLLNNDI